jgi:Tol biopolymer transport system component
VWVDRQGREEALPVAPGDYAFPAISPDGSRLAVTLRTMSSVRSDLWIYDLAKGAMTRLTFEGNNQGTLWAPDGRSVAFISNRERNPALFGNIFRKAADGTGDAEPVTSGNALKFPYGWSRNGQLVFVELQSDTKLDVRMLDLHAGGEPTTLIGTPYSDTRASLSPDERWIAYTSDESGRNEVYVRPFPDVEGGHSPRWVADTGDLVYRGNGKLMSAGVDTSSGFSVGAREPLFDDIYANDVGGMSYDVSADGKRFLMIKDGGTDKEVREIRVIVNWFEELERLVPRNDN